METFNYQAFYEKVGALNGWNFSKVRSTIVGEMLDLYAEVQSSLTPDTVLLDIGCGGGEAVLPLAERVRLLVGIDGSASMINAAERNRLAAGRRNVRFHHMQAEALQFPDAFYDVVTCRHSGFDAQEAARVLRKGGRFLSQQVAEQDRRNLKEWFGRGQSCPDRAGELMARYEAELVEAGFSDIRTFETDADVYFHGAEDLIFMLKHTPTIPDFGATDRDFELLSSFIEVHWTERGIRTNAARFMITAVR